LDGKEAPDLASPLGFPPIWLIILLDHCHHFPGFVCEKARLCPAKGTIAIHVRPRRGSKPACSGCDRLAAGCGHLSFRRLESGT